MCSGCIQYYFKHWRHRMGVVTLVSVGLLAGCQSHQWPTDTQLTLAPAQRSFDIIATIDAVGRCVLDASHYLDVPVMVVARDARGNAIGDMPFTVYADYAGNTYSGSTVLTLYSDTDGSGVVGEAAQPVSGEDDALHVSSTHRDTGERRFLLRVNLSCPYAAQVVAFAGNLTAALPIVVNAVGYRPLEADPA